MASNVRRGRSPEFPLRNVIFLTKEKAWRKREASQKEPKTVVIENKIKTEMEMAKETWIEGQCQEVEACLRKNNSKKAYQLVKDDNRETG